MHNIEFFTYTTRRSEKTIERDLNKYVRKMTWQEGGSGLYHPIRWIDKTFESYGEARGFIETNDKGWYDNLAVKYKEKLDGRTSVKRLIKIEYHT